jgi:hypothetical protein
MVLSNGTEGWMARMVAMLVRFEERQKRELEREAARRTKRERRDVAQAEIVRAALDRELGGRHEA